MAVRAVALVNAASIPAVPPDTPEPLPRHVPPTVTHPAERTRPFANVEDALVEVMLRAVDWSPAANVEVAVVEVETR